MTDIAVKPRYSEDNVQVISIGTNGFDYFFMTDSVQVVLTTIKQVYGCVYAEISVRVNEDIGLSYVKVNLNEITDRVRIAGMLNKQCGDRLFKDFEGILEYAFTQTIEQFRQPPELLDASCDPESMSVEYLVEPLLVKNNQPHCIVLVPLIYLSLPAR